MNSQWQTAINDSGWLKVRLIYRCERKGLPNLQAQADALLAKGITQAEIEDGYTDHCLRKPRPGQPAQPARDYIRGAIRDGDEVWVPRLGVLATTHEDALIFVKAISDHGGVLCDASTGLRYRVRSEAAQDVSDALRLAADIAKDEASARTARARKHKRPGKTGGRPTHSDEKIEAARSVWFDMRLSERQVAERTGIPGKTLRNHFGKRGAKLFGAALNRQRKQP